MWYERNVTIPVLMLLEMGYNQRSYITLMVKTFGGLKVALIDKNFNEKAMNIIKHKQYMSVNHPGGMMKKLFKNKKLVTVVTASYNAEDFIGKTIQSVLDQTLGEDKINHMIIDDGSNDRTTEIVRSYAKVHKNIILIELNENTGSPGTPRNIGIELAETEFITFLDADDWLHPEGLQHLVSILQETGDEYVVGKTIKVEKNGESIIGEFASVKERRQISPFDVPHFFYHMGPTAKMMRRDILIENGIRFPEMKFGEDKLFFSDLFFCAKSVSTTVKPIYFVNRLEENQSSLTRSTDVLDKRRNDLEVIKYIQSKNLPLHMQKTVLTRIYEYDFLRTFDSQLFVKSKEKEAFFEIFNDVIETTKNLTYDFLEEFKTPFYKVATRLYTEGRREDFIRMFTWLKQEKDKTYTILNGLPHFELPFLEGDERFIEVPMVAWSTGGEVKDGVFRQTFSIYGADVANVNAILIRNRKKVDKEISCEFSIHGNEGSFVVQADEMDHLDRDLYTVFVRYNEYKLINIKILPDERIIHNQKEYKFYATKANNLGFSIK
ncbi:glycosyltransferase family 2 protein [Rossellomorea marisflavi]|uniref:Glycosyltransferase family 2 protein n=2 Tax=Rossellomorea marisflavi TaxID=189381 RepID=A0A5D4RNY9_9BACI|nr:glycosyltransferase family 2 protein [Rossellomorea marisflavi]